MKQITSIETEIGKIVSQLTKEMLEKGLILTRFETGGINSWTRILVFSSTETTRKQVIFVRTKNNYHWYTEGVMEYRIYRSTMSANAASTGFLDAMFEEADKKELANLIVFTNRSKQFLLDDEEYEAMVEKRKQRSRLGYDKTYPYIFHVDRLKTVKGFKRQSATITRLTGYATLMYEIDGDEKGNKRVSYK